MVRWELSFACHNAIDATKLLAQLVGFEMGAHGDWLATLSLTQDERPGEEIEP